MQCWPHLVTSHGQQPPGTPGPVALERQRLVIFRLRGLGSLCGFFIIDSIPAPLLLLMMTRFYAVSH
jgi:hypothetical protein